MGWLHFCCGMLRHADIGSTGHAYLTIRPRLLRDPLDRVVTVGRIVHEHTPVPLGAEAPTHVLNNRYVAVPRVAGGGSSRSILSVRRAPEYGWEPAVYGLTGFGG